MTGPPHEAGSRPLARGLEFCVLFVVLPAAVACLPVRLPLLPALWILTGVCLAFLWSDPTFNRGRLWGTAGLKGHVRRIAIRFVAAALVLAVLVMVFVPGRLFGFVRARPVLWALVMVLYPVLSVYPQGIVYRAFVFHRYRVLFGGGPALVLASAGAFSLMHVVLLNWVAVSFTLIGGLLFADTYRRSNSLLASCLEHALFGGYIFTIGLGVYFYGGARFGAGPS